ncbi:MAG: type II toxin-antitoxin system ParD family antitoxin [Bacteroidales bacterium]|nr:type II toxin-antitoxin system ParD family antitoxin [Bacteroidales bacterium]NLK81717.1 hypothetical protein [Bacteroidales bacterium]HPY83060.1 hypothetical protein [Bacteroidales bacterium]
MVKNTSILLGDYFDTFIETKKAELVKELKKGERSEFVKDFNRDDVLKTLHQKHISQSPPRNILM